MNVSYLHLTVFIFIFSFAQLTMNIRIDREICPVRKKYIRFNSPQITFQPFQTPSTALPLGKKPIENLRLKNTRLIRISVLIWKEPHRLIGWAAPYYYCSHPGSRRGAHKTFKFHIHQINKISIHKPFHQATATFLHSFGAAAGRNSPFIYYVCAMCVHGAPFSFEFIFNQFFLSFSAAQYIQSKNGFLLTRHKNIHWHSQYSKEKK